MPAHLSGSRRQARHGAIVQGLSTFRPVRRRWRSSDRACYDTASSCSSRQLGDRWLISICLEILAGVAMLGARHPAVDAVGAARTDGADEHLLDAVRLYAWAELVRAAERPRSAAGDARRPGAEHRAAPQAPRRGGVLAGLGLKAGRCRSTKRSSTRWRSPRRPDREPGRARRRRSGRRARHCPSDLARARGRRADRAGADQPRDRRGLVLSERTVDSHVRNIMGKLEVNSRAQIAAWAVRHGLADASDHR